mmetsp:Transcript_11792/g.28600  ORF Transcript_11792/g.28600 Transcript_11792/m.28600 type:complete len:276 (+) Transcript_11792:232-1059(+)|eukprot:CAMPEP_0178996966 /NCGR_PEP_ID=MMETSP0795-20121207/8667_1 /TAXON_ID=88552 /ORGANISM="Amoebophrya sp., Strain Ameob2" /LENGTH=275 /DNA_ID=CAMNT_0020689425 /DNA_START=144 /DNA_END=971 /DNA_ORIENTATION=-
MEVVDIEMGMRFLSSQGYTLNVAEVAMLNASLAKLQADEKFGRIFFWGKIFGKTQDYYVAYGVRDNDIEFPSKQFYCATGETFTFGDLAMLTEDEKALIASYPAETPFAGEPDALLFPKKPDDPEDMEECPITELHRLSYTITNIDADTCVVPATAFVLNDAHQVVPSAEYAGLSWSELKELNSFAHFRPAKDIGKQRAMAKDDVEWKNCNFLDRLTSSLPTGCWAMRSDATVSSVQLRSLMWPGYVFYAVAGKPYFGSVYIGHGLQNRDLPFLL